jgi:hypothetical protein
MEFSYNASAVAAGGVIALANGRTVVVPSIASVALSPSGGEGTTIARNFYSDELSFSYAQTHVEGYRIAENTFLTRTNVCITNLRVLNALSIASIQATVTSMRRVNDPADPADDDHEFDLEASYYGVETVNDANGPCAIAPLVNISMRNVKRYGDVSNLLAARPNIAELFDSTRAKLAAALDAKAPVLGSLVDHVDHGPSARVFRAPGKPHKLVIPGVGVARFGEVMLKPGRRRVNLLRIKLGEDAQRELVADNEETQAEAREEMRAMLLEGPEDDPSQYSGGSMTFGSVEGNGSPLWP